MLCTGLMLAVAISVRLFAGTAYYAARRVLTGRRYGQ